MNKPCVYILQSARNQRYYIGSTENIARRLEEHNSGRVKATMFLLPLELKAHIVCSTIIDARKAEYRLKKYKSKKILEKVINDLTFPWEFETGL
jgi:putative endonuclease